MNFSNRRYRLRVGGRPEINPSVSGTVYVVGPEGKGYSYVRFSKTFVRALGLKMPRGVSPAYPCYLKVVRFASDYWKVFCLYMEDDTGIFLGEVFGKPKWIGKIFRSA